MKKKLFSILCTVVISSTVVLGQSTVTLDAESSSVNTYNANCWSLIQQARTATLVIGGAYSLVNSNTTPSLDFTTSYVKTPWMKMGSGNITFSARLSGSTTGTTLSRAIVVSYIPYDPSSLLPSKEGSTTTFYTYNFLPPLSGTGSQTIQNLSVPIPVEIANSTGVYKIMVSFIGDGGAGRIISDNYIFPGTYGSDPANSCLPAQPFLDADEDGVQNDQDMYPADASRAYNSYYPSEVSYGTLAFEDNWPSKGDYDFNDVVVDYRMKTVTNSSNFVVEVIGEFILKASGAIFNNGFGFQLDGIGSDKISGVTGNSVSPSSPVFNIAPNGVESGQTYATCIVFDNFFNVIPRGPDKLVNTIKESSYIYPAELTVNVAFVANSVPIGDFSSLAFNFFIVADDTRGKEIHLPNRVPTNLANASLFGLKDDDSSIPLAKYYKTLNNLPWGLNIIQGFQYPIELAPINEVYLYFIEWAESNGTARTDWFSNTGAGYRNQFKVY
ncbi:MAG: hypothetical protein ACD_77C00477G0043 [uncultured bacterium]|nr:MAG: hypothetical protein ACD_77C00477G0043 [uncultured bacterium]HBY02716.1 hypothetical protein [Rikenellaceae bacterium]